MRARLLPIILILGALALALWPRPPAPAPVDGQAVNDQDSDGGAGRGDLLSVRDSAPPPDALIDAAGLPGGTIEGRVVDEAGGPVAGAQVTVVAGDPPAPILKDGSRRRLIDAGELGILQGHIPYPPLGGALPSLLLGADSDADGHFHIGGVPAGHLAVSASHPRFLDGRSAFLDLADGGRGEAAVTLRAGLLVRGRIVDENGPVAAAELWRDGLLAATTGPDGRFELGRLEGPVEIEARAVGHSPTRMTLDPHMGEVDLHLGLEAGHVTGVVVDERGLPLSGVAVAATGGGGEDHRTTTDRRGEFRFEGCGSGVLKIVARTRGRPPAVLERAGAGEDVRLLLMPGGGIAGQIVDATTGTPIDATITVRDAAGEEQRIVSDGGRFRVTGLAAGLARLGADADGHIPAGLRVDVPAGETFAAVTVDGLRIPLPPGGWAIGRIFDEHGAPATAIEVRAAGLVSRSDGDGRYRIGPLPEGNQRIQAGHASDKAHIVAGREAVLDLRL